MSRVWPLRDVVLGSIMLLVAVVAQAASGGSSSSLLRSSVVLPTGPAAVDAGGSSPSNPRRYDVIREHRNNGEVRKQVRLVEERSQRSQTGFLGDPNHVVPYENHPYDRSNKRRSLQAEDNSTATYGDGTTSGGADAYRPLRIRFETQALDDMRTSDNAAKIDFIKTEVLIK
jgi:hypothetical protein